MNFLVNETNFGQYLEQCYSAIVPYFKLIQISVLRTCELQESLHYHARSHELLGQVPPPSSQIVYLILAKLWICQCQVSDYRSLSQLVRLRWVRVTANRCTLGEQGWIIISFTLEVIYKQTNKQTQKHPNKQTFYYHMQRHKDVKHE